MNQCLKGIVPVSDRCSGTWLPSLSGYDLMKAPEISVANLAAMANENYVSGLQLARDVMDQAVLDVSNDFIAVLNTNNVTTNIVQRPYNTSTFIPGVNMGNAAVERGVTLYKSKKIRGRLLKPTITSIDVFPLTSISETYLSIIDNGNAYRYKVQLIAGQVNTFPISHIMQGTSLRVVIDNTNVQLASAYVQCGEGCQGKEPNGCAFARGFDGYTDTRNREGYGINVNFTCACDYESMLCDLSKTYVGKIIYYKARILLMEMRLKTNRLNNWIIYDREQIEKDKKELEGEYVSTWNAFVAGLFGTLKNYKDECIICRGIQWKVNR